MIFLTKAPNDQDLLPLFKGLAIPGELELGDFHFFGKWENGKDVFVVGERKKLGDLIQCIEDGRHVRQIQTARENGAGFLFLVLEGQYRPNPTTGVVQERRGSSYKDHESSVSFYRVKSYLEELDWYGGVHVRETRTPVETVRAVRAVYNLFSKDPDEHSSLRTIYTPDIPRPRGYVSFLGKRPNLVTRVAKELDGIGTSRAISVGQHFKSVRSMMDAGVKDWMQIEGIGKKTAEGVVRQLNE